MTPAERHRRHSADFARLTEQVEDWSAPAPVDGWTARDVVAHLVDWFPGFLSAGAGIELAEVPAVADDPVGAWREHSAQVQALLDDAATAGRRFNNPHTGEHPLPEAVDRFYTTDVLLHSWDLSRAAGLLDHSLDPDECAAMLPGLVQMEDALRDSGQFGPAFPVPPDAPISDRLMGFLGRDPGFGRAR